ncbi:unnamed protein product [Effrenium voratum]|uniref:Exostosin GT47 domain-containing protein n=1 Tax=Effrenium voratum TaxID=2562239 RepID=A0AA36IS66_9DINO|nr:unnamed protein product [Effrenium voratum]
MPCLGISFLVPALALELPDCTHELCVSTKYDPEAASPVACEVSIGELQPEFFRHLGGWQKRYGRDNLQLSSYFLRDIFQAQIETRLSEALESCPGAVLEIMMNGLLAVETRQGRDAAREFLLRIYSLRDIVLERGDRWLEQLMLEWNADIAFVYPKLLDIQRLGPDSKLATGEEEPCLGQRVYLYTLPAQLYGGTLECLQGQWGTEVLLQHYFRHNCNTQDPDLADWFYVPLHATCLYVKLNENVSEHELDSMDSIANTFIWEPLLQALRDSPYYHRFEGTDHIFLFADGQGPRIWDSYDLLRESVFLSPESRCPTWNEPLRRYVDVKRCLSSWKDIVIPGHTDYARIQYMKRHNKRSAERRLLMTFHGRAPEIHGAYSQCAVRGMLMKLGVRLGLEEGVDIGGFVGDYLERKGDSHFCLVPAGTSPWTNHLYESFFAGCIPVILSDEYEVAFLEELPWEQFSIKWPESRVCEDEACTSSSLYDHLRALAQQPDRLWQMKRELELHSCYFNWYSTDAVCSPYHLLHRRLGDLLKRRSRQRRRFWNWDGSAGSDSHFVHLARATRFKAENESSNFSWLLPVLPLPPTDPASMQAQGREYHE